MVAIRRWEPFRDLRHIERDVARFWGPRMDLFQSGPHFKSGYGHFPVDVYEDGGQLVVKAGLPGLKPEDLDLTVEDNVLTIKGETKSETSNEEGNYLHRERLHGAFRRSIYLPKSTDSGKAESSYEDGVLTVSFPRREEFQPKQLKITVGKGSNGKSSKSDK